MSRFSWHPSADSKSAEAPSSARGLLRVIAGGTLNYGLGSTLPLVIGFLLIPVYTALLTPADYGIVDMSAALAAVVTVFMRLGVPGAVTRFYYEHAEGPELRDYVTSVAWFLRVSAIGVGAIVLVILYFWGHRLVPGLPFMPFAVLTVVVSALSVNSDLQRRLVQVRRQSAYSAKLSIANSLLSIALAITFVVGLRWGALGMLAAQAITGCAFLVNATMYLWPDLKGTTRPRILKESIHYGTGIFASHLMANGGPLVSRALLAGVASISSVGLYALANRVTSPLSILSQAFQTAYVPEYFAARKDGSAGALQSLAKAESSFWTVGVQGTLAAAVLGPTAVTLMTPHRFHAAAPLVPILALGFLAQMLYALMSPEMFYVKKRWLPPLVTGTNIATTVLLTFALVKPYGAHGVAWASVAGSMAGGLVCILLAARTAPIPHDWTSLFRAVGVSLTAFAGFTLLTPARPVASLAFGASIVAANALVLFLAGDPLMRRLPFEIRLRLFPKAEVAR